MSENKYPNSVLFQRLEALYSPAQDWETCTMPLTMFDFLEKIKDNMPGFFESDDQIVDVLEQLHFKFVLNENNKKHYWLVNSP